MYLLSTTLLKHNINMAVLKVTKMSILHWKSRSRQVKYFKIGLNLNLAVIILSNH